MVSFMLQPVAAGLALASHPQTSQHHDSPLTLGLAGRMEIDIESFPSGAGSQDGKTDDMQPATLARTAADQGQENQYARLPGWLLISPRQLAEYHKPNYNARFATHSVLYHATDAAAVFR